MQQLVGFGGQRFYMAMKLMELMALAAFGVLFLLLIYTHGQQLLPLSFVDLGVFLVASALVMLAAGVRSRSMKGAAIRLGFSTNWWAAPLAVGLAAVGSEITLMLMNLNASTPVNYLPADLGWAAAIALSGLVFAKDILRFKAARSQMCTRQAALDEIATGDYDAQQLHRLKITCAADSQLLPDNLLTSPKGRPLYGLSARPWYEVSDFSWAQELEKHSQEILDEALGVLQDETGFHGYSYPGINKGGWRSFSFVDEGRINEQNMQRCPRTAALLQSIPRYPYFRDAMFSLLEPGAVIPRHQDYHNVFLTCHLGLQIPSGAYIQVAGMKRSWKEGECLIFDSSFSHSACNNSDQRRLVLLIDFLHPEINDAEVAWLKQVGLIKA